MRPVRDQESMGGGVISPSATRETIAQLVRREFGVSPGAIGYNAVLALMPPAIYIERPVRNFGHSAAPRQSMSPCQLGRPSFG